MRTRTIRSMWLAALTSTIPKTHHSLRAAKATICWAIIRFATMLHNKVWGLTHSRLNRCSVRTHESLLANEKSRQRTHWIIILLSNKINRRLTIPFSLYLSFFFLTTTNWCNNFKYIWLLVLQPHWTKWSWHWVEPHVDLSRLSEMQLFVLLFSSINSCENVEHAIYIHENLPYLMNAYQSIIYLSTFTIRRSSQPYSKEMCKAKNIPSEFHARHTL